MYLKLNLAENQKHQILASQNYLLLLIKKVQQQFFNQRMLLSGFQLAICESQFADQICFYVDHFKQFLWNSQIKTFLLLEFLYSGKPQSFCLHSNSTNRLCLTPKSVKLYTNVLHLDSILAPNPQWGEGGLKRSLKNFSVNLRGSLLKRQFEPWVFMWSQAGKSCVLFI